MNITMTITLAVPDDDPTNGGDFAADLVAHVLTHYSDPTIIITRDVAAVAATETGPLHPLVAAVMASEAPVCPSEPRNDHDGYDDAPFADDDRPDLAALAASVDRHPAVANIAIPLDEM